MSILYFLAMVTVMLLMCGIVLVSIAFGYLFIASGFMKNSPSVPSSGKIKREIINDIAAQIQGKKDKTVMDLGSGWGSMLLPLARLFPEHEFIGIELAKLPYYMSRLRACKLPNVHFKRENFFTANIADADVIFLFLLPSVMGELTLRFRKECKKGCLIYANRFPLQGIKPEKTVSLGSKYYTYYVYHI